MLYLLTTLYVFQEKGPGPLLSRHIEEWSGKKVGMEFPRDVTWKWGHRVWEKISEGKPSNGSSEVSLQCGHQHRFRHAHVLGWMSGWGCKLKREVHAQYCFYFGWYFLRWTVGTLMILWVSYLLLSYTAAHNSYDIMTWKVRCTWFREFCHLILICKFWAGEFSNYQDQWARGNIIAIPSSCEHPGLLCTTGWSCSR